MQCHTIEIDYVTRAIVARIARSNGEAYIVRSVDAYGAGCEAATRADSGLDDGYRRER